MTRKLILPIYLTVLLILLTSCFSADHKNSGSITNVSVTALTEPESLITDKNIPNETESDKSETQTETTPLADESLFGTYIYEGDGIGGDFCIKIYPDGTFYYYEGFASSHIGMGNWKIDGDIICIDDSNEYSEHKHYFKISENQLTFIEKVSNNFIYVKLKDGARFIKQTEEQTN